MESEVQEKASVTELSITERCLETDISKGEDRRPTVKVSECSSSDCQYNLGTTFETKKPCNSEDCDILNEARESYDDDCDNGGRLDGRASVILFSESVDNNTESLSGKNKCRTEPFAPLSPKGSVLIMNEATERNRTNFGNNTGVDDILVLKNLDELRGKETSDDNNSVDLTEKLIVTVKNVGEIEVKANFEESSCIRSSESNKCKVKAHLCSDEDASICDSFSGRSAFSGSIVSSAETSHGEVSELETYDISGISSNKRIENPVYNDCDVNASKFQDCGTLNSATVINISSVVKEGSNCQFPDAKIHNFSSISDSAERTTVVSNARSKGPLNYRDSASSSSESELSSSSDDESISEQTDVDGQMLKHGRRPEPVCHGEMLLNELPPIEDLNISVSEEDCIKIGEISSIVGELAVIQALPNTPALDLDSVLFLDHGKIALGKIFDVLGPVKEPFYTVRFNSENHARERGVTVGADVFCAPRTDHTAYVFLAEMMKIKGSDASWEHNNEPPPLCVDYSDDEQERLARRSFVHQRHVDNRDGGPPRKRRGIRHRMGNSYQSNGTDQRKNTLEDARSDSSSVRGYIPHSLPQTTSFSSIFPSHPVFPSAPQRIPGGFTGPYNRPSLMMGGPTGNFTTPMRSGFNSPFFEAPPRNFPPSSSPTLPPNLHHSMNSHQPYFIRPFHMLPSVPLVPLPPLPPYLSSPHVRPFLCPPRFRPPMDDHRGQSNF